MTAHDRTLSNRFTLHSTLRWDGVFVSFIGNIHPENPMKSYCLLLPASRATPWSLCGILAAFASLCPLSEKARAAAYTFTNIADTNGVFAPTTMNAAGLGDTALSLNNAGMVTFTTRLEAGGGGVFVGSGGPVQSIALTSGPVFNGVLGSSINSAGTVAFTGTLESGVRGVFTSSGGQITTIALNSEPTFSSFGGPAINDAGTIGFRVTFTDGSRGILTRASGSTATIAAESGPLFSSVAGNLSINSAGTVAFLGGLENGQGGFFTGSGSPPTTIATGNFSGIGVSSINDAGAVTFLPASGSAVT